MKLSRIGLVLLMTTITINVTNAGGFRRASYKDIYTGSELRGLRSQVTPYYGHSPLLRAKDIHRKLVIQEPFRLMVGSLYIYATPDGSYYADASTNYPIKHNGQYLAYKGRRPHLKTPGTRLRVLIPLPTDIQDKIRSIGFKPGDKSNESEVEKIPCKITVYSGSDQGAYKLYTLQEKLVGSFDLTLADNQPEPTTDQREGHNVQQQFQNILDEIAGLKKMVNQLMDKMNK